MPPRGEKKGTKRARQYEKIKKSVKQRGAPEDRAEEIAARTVNKGAPAAASRASAPAPLSTTSPRGAEGRSRLNKSQLQRAVDRKKS